MDCQKFDEQVVRLDTEIAAIARDYVLARVTNMRGVNLNVFTFDYDLTWMAFVIDADERIYARYGSRESQRAEDQLSLGGLRYTLRLALAAYRRGEKPPPPAAEPPRSAEQYPAAQRLKADACIHCHEVYNFRNEQQFAAGTWTKDDVWSYTHPPPRTVGLTLDVDRGDHVKAVAPDSPAVRAGLRPGDVLRQLNRQSVLSISDAQYALHLAPKAGSIPVTWRRDGQEQSGTLELPAGWRQSDISWRTSMWNLPPAASVYGKDLTAEEKRKLGLAEKRLAFRQGQFVPPAAKRAGIREGDVILGVAGRELAMTMLEFNAHVRLTYTVGDTVTYELIRDGRRLQVPVTLPGKPF